MSQNDHVIANANGATVRADINSALQALASANSGSTAPSTTYNNQWWFDTTADILKIRDEANANWVNVASLVGTTWIPYSNGSLLGTLANQNASAVGVNLVMNAKSVAFASTAVSSGTPDFATSGNVVTLSATATANTLGTVQAGFIGVIHYGISLTITHNGTSRILPTAGNIVTQVGDVEIVLSLGSGNWRTISYMRADGTAIGAGSATQAQMEAASSTAVFSSPGRQHNHPGHPKAWVNFNGTGVVAIAQDYGVASITDNGTGDYTVNFDTAFADTNYASFGTARHNQASTIAGLLSMAPGDSKSTSAFRFGVAKCTDAVRFDSAEVGIAFTGDL